MTSCNKWAEDRIGTFTVRQRPPERRSATPLLLAGAIKGTMLQGKTYTIDSDIYVNDGDTLMIQPGVTLDFHNGSGFVILGSLFSEGTQAQPIYMTVPGVTKNNSPGLTLTQDSAHIGLWRGLIGGTK